MLQGSTMEFPSAYVWVRQLGVWKLHPYNFIALIDVIYNHPNFAQSAHALEEFLNFVIRTVMTMFEISLSSQPVECLVKHKQHFGQDQEVPTWGSSGLQL